jgi:hypothetical protein
MEKLVAMVVTWMLGLIVALPNLLMRAGFWKSWYLSPTIPPFAVKRMLYLGIPFSLFFWCLPIVLLLPIDDQAAMAWSGRIGIAGVLLGIAIAFIAPSWAKPAWQRRLEDRYDQDEIAIFVRVWQQMDRKEWGRLIETEEGLKQLVERSGGQYRRGPKPPAGPDDDRLWLVK